MKSLIQQTVQEIHTMYSLPDRYNLPKDIQSKLEQFIKNYEKQKYECREDAYKFYKTELQLREKNLNETT